MIDHTNWVGRLTTPERTARGCPLWGSQRPTLQAEIIDCTLDVILDANQ
jgi:hypothetical protein